LRERERLVNFLNRKTAFFKDIKNFVEEFQLNCFALLFVGAAKALNLNCHIKIPFFAICWHCFVCKRILLANKNYIGNLNEDLMSEILGDVVNFIINSFVQQICNLLKCCHIFKILTILDSTNIRTLKIYWIGVITLSLWISESSLLKTNLYLIFGIIQTLIKLWRPLLWRIHIHITNIKVFLLQILINFHRFRSEVFRDVPPFWSRALT
jgi:hypothetical protein